MSTEYEYPLLLNASENLIFKEVVDKRLKFSSFFNKTFNKFIIKLLKSYLLDTDNYIFLVAGSRAWDNLLSNSNIELTDLEAASIKPGNYDIFCICKNKKDIDNIITKYCEIFDKIALFCEQSNINISYEINYNDNKKKNVKKVNSIDCVMNNNYSKDGCVFPPCKAMHMEINDDNNEYNEKVLIYFELLLIEKEDIISYTHNNIIDYKNYFNFLNLKGIYLFSELIISLRIEKEYDIDSYRKNILQKLLEYENMDKLKIYNKIIQIYTYMFSDRLNYTLMKINLIKNFVFLSDKNIVDNYNSYLTEQFRPYINTFINQTSISIDTFNSTIFVTGGDAYRRYIPDIKKTNDIDIKISYINIKDYASLLTTVISEMSKLIYILNTNKLPQESDKIKINNIISIKFIPKCNCGQFRLRYTKNDDFTLLSIDYRYKLQININNNDNTNSVVLNQEFTLLDVVLYHDNKYLNLKDKKKPSKKDIILFNKLKSVYDNKSNLPNVTYDGNIPIASAEYLIYDLRNIYENIKDLRRRFHKNSKDKQRFINLIKFIKKSNADKQIDINLNTILKINTDNYKGIHFEDTNQNQSVYIGENLNIQILPSILHNNNKIINQYTDKFIRSIRKIDKYKIDKFKMTFDAIQDISKDNNDINIDINRITETLSTVSINDNMIINNINVYENSDIDELLNKLDI